MAKILKSRWLWYPQFGFLVFVALGYISVARSSLDLPSFGQSLELPWLVRHELVGVVKSRSKLKSDEDEEYQLLVVDYYLCLFGKVTEISHSYERVTP
jgi:hypothetical protein